MANRNPAGENDIPADTGSRCPGPRRFTASDFGRTWRTGETADRSGRSERRDVGRAHCRSFRPCAQQCDECRLVARWRPNCNCRFRQFRADPRCRNGPADGRTLQASRRHRIPVMVAGRKAYCDKRKRRCRADLGHGHRTSDRDFRNREVLGGRGDLVAQGRPIGIVRARRRGDLEC